mmetsp:Transcript_47434/g.62760  ORF Transcript_47434/g.62760 Transcript_47434/m.62760 type:complete len:117 (-) Transcript_47434:733-1083(-)
MSKYYNYSTATLFCCTGASCLTMLIFLISIIRRTFTDELNSEMKQLVITEITFVVTFLLRVILILFVQVGHWVDFTRDYPHDMTPGFETIMFPTQFIIYNFVPYTTLMYMHYKNFN